MTPKCCFIVVRSTPASTNAATSASSALCALMSGVWNIERVNMSSQVKLALLAFSSPRSTGSAVSTIEQMCPWGATTSAMVFQWASVWLRQST